MDKLKNYFEWLDRDYLYWPESDTKLKLVNDWVYDIDKIIRNVKGRSLAIQAGGACGLWPAKLSTLFDKVITCEPCAENYKCLTRNCESKKNIEHHLGALWHSTGAGVIKRDDFEKGNSGAWYVQPVQNGDFRLLKIDDFKLEACDLILLDVEGSELMALEGAKNTIKEFNPVIVVEQKQLPHMKYKIAKLDQYIGTLGYRKIEKYHNDAVYVC